MGIRFALLALVLAVGIVPRPAGAAQLPVRVVAVVDDVRDPVVRPAYEVEYAVEVINPTTEALTGVTVTAATPAGTFFGEASTSVGEIAAPPQGQKGPMVVAVGTLAPGAAARIRFELGLDPDVPARLSFAATVATDSTAPAALAETTFFADRGNPVLRWEGIVPFGPDATHVPRELRVERAEDDPVVPVLFPLDGGLADVEYRVYRSDAADVDVVEGNLVATLPGTQHNTGPLPGPGFYTVTAVRGGVESAPAPTVSYGMSEPFVERITVKSGVLKATGSNFDAGVEVTVDGLTFTKAASVKRESTQVRQSGRLSNGQSLTRYLREHVTVLVAFRNENGGVTAVRYGRLIPPV
jgi:uncharacterized repeat protein (TIGR01451 family)